MTTYNTLVLPWLGGLKHINKITKMHQLKHLYIHASLKRRGERPLETSGQVLKVLIESKEEG